jgi:hypothetical protein
MSIIVFSGYQWEKVRESKNQSIRGLLTVLDAVITGPYSEKVWKLDKCISKEIHILSKRYEITDFELKDQYIEAIPCLDGFMLLGFEDVTAYSLDFQRMIGTSD